MREIQDDIIITSAGVDQSLIERIKVRNHLSFNTIVLATQILPKEFGSPLFETTVPLFTGCH